VKKPQWCERAMFDGSGERRAVRTRRGRARRRCERIREARGVDL
jgi:hypothetical protein